MRKKKQKKENKNRTPVTKHSEVDTSEASEATELNEFEKKIQELEDELSLLQDKYQRICAEYDNLQKRVPKQIQDGISYQKESILKSLLASMDNFEHTLASFKTDHQVDSVIEGVKLVYKGFLDAFKTHGVEQMVSVDQEFDPSRHSAMMQQCDTEKPDNTVLSEYQKGYFIKEKVLRPAMVIVNKIESETEEQAHNNATEDLSQQSGPESPQDNQE